MHLVTGVATGLKEAVVGPPTRVSPEDADKEAAPEEPGVLHSIADKVVGVGAGAAGVAASAAGGAASVAASGASAAGHAAGAAADIAFTQVTALATDSKERMHNLVMQLRAYLEAWIKGKIQARTEWLVDKLPGIIQYVLEDPEMPRCVSRGKDRLVMSIWPDIREEIMWEVAVMLDGTDKDKEVDNRKGVCCLRAFLRYHLQPYDHGIWGQMRDPWFWVLRAIALVPVYAVSPAFFLFVFIIIDKKDEYQLIAFILGFKGTQFLSQGVIKSITGFVQFMMCVTAPAKKGEHHCEDTGPGTKGDLPTIAAGFVLQVVLVWIAFWLLRCSVENGRSSLKGSIGHEHGGASATKGGYISYFLWYDLVCFIFCCGFPAYVLITRPKFEPDDWVLAHTVYAAQILYGLLSAPFFLFTLPGMQRVLTHAYPTAYDRQGRCRPPISPKPPREEKPPETGEVVSEEETATILRKLREYVGIDKPSD
mmetsp:Transcript_30383/g.55228  ORF Transcript_30383/g.55228 Transcript_30383/m.55228 type:complete len:479 (-) Transcript_30383:96-1532(-)